MTREQADKLLEAHVSQLSEHFNSVEILASYPDPEGGTRGLSCGAGDWYARHGLACEFVSRAQAQQIGGALRPADDDE